MAGSGATMRLFKDETASPVTALGLCVSLTLALLAFGGMITWRVYAGLCGLATTELRVTYLNGVIAHLDETLTMSARMAAATGDANWERRYRVYEPQLDAAIREVTAIAPEASS